jgi:hypothetical protein
MMGAIDVPAGWSSIAITFACVETPTSLGFSSAGNFRRRYFLSRGLRRVGRLACDVFGFPIRQSFVYRHLLVSNVKIDVAEIRAIKVFIA